MLLLNTSLFVLQFSYGFFQSGYLLLGVALFLSFERHDRLRGIGNEFLGGQSLVDAGKEAFKMLQLCLCLLYLCSHVNLVSKRNGILCSANHER